MKEVKRTIVLKPSDKTEKIIRVDYSDIKTAIDSQNLEALVRVFEYFRAADSQIGSELFKRRVYVSSLPLFFESEDKKQNEFVSSLIENIWFKRFLFDCTAGIAYGFAPFIKEWQSVDGKILPKFRFVSHAFFNTDREDRLYLKQGIDKIFIDASDEFWLHHHPADSGDIITQSLMYKLVVITALKHLTISKYMSFFDSLSVPPLIVKSDAVDDEKQSEAILEAAINLRANGVGLFSKNDLVELLSGNVDKATFLDFIKYCDDAISKLITGQTLAGNVQANGNRALGEVHNEIRQDILRFDAMLLSASMHSFIKEVLKLNFANVADFKFILDAGLEADEEKLSSVYEKITNMGYEIPVEFMEETFKIKGLKFKNGDQILEKKEVSKNSLEYNQKPQSAKSDKSLVGVQGATPPLARTALPSAKLPIDNIDAALLGKDFNRHEKDVLKDIESSLNSLLKECKSYEDAFSKLAQMYKEINTSKLEEIMFNAIANAEIYGNIDE